MDANLDALLTTLFVRANDLLPERQKNAARRVADAEVVTLWLAQAIMGIPSDRRFLAVAGERLAHLSRACRSSLRTSNAAGGWRTLVKPAAERASGRILGVHLLGNGAGDALLAGVCAIEARMTVEQMANGWNPYLTIGEAIHFAAQSLTRNPTPAVPLRMASSDSLSFSLDQRS